MRLNSGIREYRVCYSLLENHPRNTKYSSLPKEGVGRFWVGVGGGLLPPGQR